MTQQWTAPAWLALIVAAVLVALALVSSVALVAARRAAAATRDLRDRVADLDRRLAAEPPGPEPLVTAPSPRETPDYVITRLGDEQAAPPAVVPPAVFADLVLREGVVQSAALLHGLRRALAPESRNRIRFAVRQEVKRSRKARRAEQRAVLREGRARQRAAESAA